VPNYRDDDTISAPSGVQISVKDSGNRNFVIESLSEPGVYMRAKAAGGQPEPVIAANADRFESHLAP
jgi:hypothetical protein